MVQSSMKMARAFALLAIYSLVATSVSAQSDQDNIVDLLRSIVNTAADSYINTNGVISLPDIKGASQGTIGNLGQIQRDPIACYAAPMIDNPRAVDYRFRLPEAIAKYEKYQVHMFSPIRTLTYAIHDIDFSMKGTIEIRERGCMFVLQKVGVVSTASTKNPQVTGGIVPFMNDILSGFMKSSVNTIIEHVRKDIETRIRTIIVDGSFKCATYKPSQLLSTPQPSLEQSPPQYPNSNQPGYPQDIQSPINPPLIGYPEQNPPQYPQETQPQLNQPQIDPSLQIQPAYYNPNQPQTDPSLVQPAYYNPNQPQLNQPQTDPSLIQPAYYNPNQPQTDPSLIQPAYYNPNQPQLNQPQTDPSLIQPAYYNPNQPQLNQPQQSELQQNQPQQSELQQNQPQPNQ